MSQNIFCEPVKPPKAKCLSTSAPQGFWDTLEEAFTTYDTSMFILDEESIPILRGLSILNNQTIGNPYQEIIDEIKKHKKVKITKQ